MDLENRKNEHHKLLKGGVYDVQFLLPKKNSLGVSFRSNNLFLG